MYALLLRKASSQGSIFSTVSRVGVSMGPDQNSAYQAALHPMQLLAGPIRGLEPGHLPRKESIRQSQSEGLAYGS